jgi:dihydromethanopterin reductase (acceptor)
MKTEPIPRFAWGITGSGHYLKESLALCMTLPGVDLFLSKAGEEILHMYGYKLNELKTHMRIFRDNTASAAPVGLFYHDHYHTVIIGPASSNTVAKCALGISDSLITNIFAQAGKCGLQSIVFACDTEPEVTTESPSEWVTLNPRRIDLQHSNTLKTFENVQVVSSVEALQQAITDRMTCLNISSS